MIRLLILLTFASPVFAAPVPKPEAVKPEHFTEHRILLLRSSAVQKELALSAEQRIAVIDHFEVVDEEYFRKVFSLYAPSSPVGDSPEESAKKGQLSLEYEAKRSAKSRDALAEVIKTPQLARLLELERRYLGHFAFIDAEVVAELKLTPAQVTAVAKAIEGFRKPYEVEFGPRVKPSGRSILEVSKPTLDAILKALTSEQQARWKELLGKEPKIATTGIPAARHLISAAAEKAYPPAKDD
jgi:hypothetical protein